MVCQYSRPSQVSSEKHETTADLEQRRRLIDRSVMTVTVVVGSYRPLPEPPSSAAVRLSSQNH